MSEFISVDVGGGGVIVVINILYCLLVCIFFTHFLSPLFAVSPYFWQYSRISSTFALSSVANITDIKIQRRDENKNLGKKVNLRSLSLYHYYSYSLTLSNIGEPSWS